jgi:hypothetical protein
MYKQKERTRQESDVDKYNKYRNILNKVIRTAKKMYWQLKFSNSLNDSKETWRNINLLIKKQTCQHDQDYFSHEENILKDPNEIANAFNSFYVNIGKNIANSVQAPTTHSNIMPSVNQTNSLYLTPSTEIEVLQIIDKMKPKTSCGHDNISVKLIKQTSLAIITPLTYIINLSLGNGSVPENMKFAKVLPIFKNGDKDQIKNYRPISLLPSFSKILEKVIHRRLFKFLTNNNLLFASQYGFRKNYSTELGILEFQNRIITHIRNKNSCLGLFLDLSKAFDSLQHNILLSKLEHYGIRGIALNWFRSYLSNRSQSVNFLNASSQSLKIDCGVPQGSVLGPLLFLIYVNDLPNCSTSGEFIIYADDTNIIFTHKDKAKLLENINKEISHIANWFNCNKLSINTDKTNFMLFKDNNMNECSALAVKINGCTINRTNKVKFLGVEIQSDLSWNAHCNTKANKMSQSLAVLSKVKHLLPKSAMLSIYHSLIESHINYSILSWGKTCQRQINRVRTIQKRAVRIICKQRYNSHTDPLFRDYNY